MANNEFDHTRTDFVTQALGAARPPYDFLAKELEFEAALRGSWPPSVMACLHTVPEASRAEALPRLMGVELNHRVNKKECPKLSDYVAQFPTEEVRLRQIFAEREISEYFLGAMLGKGGMGEVFKALHKTMLRHVAVKLMRPRHMKDPAPYLNRFLREIKANGQLIHHENIVYTENAGLLGDSAFLVMELIDGADLAQISHEVGPLPTADACAVIAQAATGLQYAHEKKFVHRDIKPHNLMLTRTGQVKVMDLGLALCDVESHLVEQLTQEGRPYGTVDYMAPEQCKNAHGVDIRADIYSLGCTLYQLLSGRPPFGTEAYSSAFSKMSAHCNETVPDIRLLRNDLPKELLAILRRMLDKDPAKRFSEPIEVAQALAPLAVGADLPVLLRQMRTTSVDETVPINKAHGTTLIDPTSKGNTSRGSGIGNSKAPARLSGGVSRWSWLLNSKVLGAGALGAALVLGLVLWLQRGSTAPVVPPPSPPHLADALATLPGLNGNWWFDEYPWLTPDVRQLLLDEISSPAEAADHSVKPVGEARVTLADLETDLASGDVTTFTAHLRTHTKQLLVAAKDPARESRVNRFFTLVHLSPSYESFVPKSVPKALHNLFEQDADVAGMSLSQKAARLHWLAVAQHQQLAKTRTAIADRDAKWTEVESAYNEAVIAYELARTNPTKALPLHALCLADRAQMRQDRRQWNLAASDLEAALNLPVSQTPEFQVWVLCSLGDDYCQVTKFDLARDKFKQARDIARDLPDPDHNPLRAYALERSGWCYLDSSGDRSETGESVALYGTAEEVFRKARDMRHQAVSASSKKTEKDCFAIVSEIWDQHGMAVAQQMQGQEDAAVDTFKKLVDQIDAAIGEAGLMPYTVDRLYDRKQNSLERWGDCDLFRDGADAAMFTQAATRYNDASKTIEQHDLGDGNLRDTYVKLAYKEALADALAGNQAAARSALDLAEKRYESNLTRDDQDDFELVRALASAAVEGMSATDDTGKTACLEPVSLVLTSDAFRKRRSVDPHSKCVKLSRDERQLLMLLCTQFHDDSLPNYACNVRRSEK